MYNSLRSRWVLLKSASAPNATWTTLTAELVGLALVSLSTPVCCLASVLVALEAAHLFSSCQTLSPKFRSGGGKPFVCFFSVLKFFRNGRLLSGLLSSLCEALPGDEAYLSVPVCY